MNRHQLREKLLVCIYQSLLLKKDLSEVVSDNFDDGEDVDVFFTTLIDIVNKNKEDYIGYINAVSDDWAFDRLGYLEQAILLISCAEFDAKETSANIIIDEAIILAKDYCDEQTYKLINGILDRL